MARLLKSKGFAAILGVLLYLGVTLAVWRTPSPPPPAPEEPSLARKIVNGPSWDFTNPEVDQLVLELKKERAALAERERQLDEFAARIKAEQAELNATTQRVHQLQRELDQTFVRVQEEETANLKKLAKVYSGMTPEGAASILKQLDETTIVKILVFMKEEQTAPILETLAKLGDAEAKLAASISERLRLAVFRKPAEKSRS